MDEIEKPAERSSKRLLLADSLAQAPHPAERAHLALYDGFCGMCNSLVQFLLRHDGRGVFAFASLQSATGRTIVEGLGGDPNHLTSFYVVVNYRTRHRRVIARSTAALFVAGQLGWPWKAAVIARLLPRAVLDRAYDVIARNRHRVFGRYDRCPSPPPGFRDRFIDG